jgi:hypothetical protein
MLKSLLYLTLLSSLSFVSNAQKRFVTVADDSFTINSQTALNGKTFNVVEATLPDKAIGVIYRITSGSKGTLKQSKPLLLQLRDYTPEDFTINNSLGRLTIKADQPRPINIYVLDHVVEAGKMQASKPFVPCKQFENRSEICFYSNECLTSSKLFFGFVNPDVSIGADVQFELIAIIDDKAEAKVKDFPFVITNKSNSSVQIQWSKDGNIQSAVETFPGGTVYTARFPDKLMYITVRTSLFKFKKFQVFSDAKYEIFWNATFNGWDLAKG